MSEKRLIRGTLEKLGTKKVTGAGYWTYSNCIVDGEKIKAISLYPEQADKVDSGEYEFGEGMEVHMKEGTYENKFNVLSSTFGAEHSIKKSNVASTVPSSGSSSSSTASSSGTQMWTVDRIKPLKPYTTKNGDYFPFRVENTEGEEGIITRKKNDSGLEEGKEYEFEVTQKDDGTTKIKIPYRPDEKKAPSTSYGGSSKGSTNRGSAEVNTFLFGSTTKLVGDCITAGITDEDKIKEVVRLSLSIAQEIEAGNF